DHEQIDRTDTVVRLLLLRLARSRVAAQEPASAAAPHNDWRAAISRWSLPAPDVEPLTVNGTIFPLAWRNHLAAVAIGALDDGTRVSAEALGYTTAILPEAPGEQPPTELLDLLGVTA